MGSSGDDQKSKKIMFFNFYFFGWNSERKTCVMRGPERPFRCLDLCFFPAFCSLLIYPNSSMVANIEMDKVVDKVADMVVGGLGRGF